MQQVIGIDLGGTNLRVAVVNEEGNIMEEKSTPTDSSRGPEAIMEDMIRFIKDFQKIYPINGVGIGSPGPLDAKAGVILNPPNLPGWERVPLTKQISDAVDLPVFLENDANVAALAEATSGAGVGYESVYYITWSTGIGGGFVLDGKLQPGAAGYAGEIGNMIVQPGGTKYATLNPGALEAVASGTAIGLEGKRQLGIEGGAEAVFNLAQKGNTEAKRIIDDAIHNLAIGIANITFALDPSLFILGGGVMQAEDELLTSLHEKVTSILYEGQTVDMKKATLGGKAGVIGAAQLAFK
ncbi:ROK family protein [Pontibacillus yanchengensis]|uniref:ROK family transcriptional regulator n=1 Tax=Pontibacillus yanchengensis Y32 TaxID=1385514 RepID=A0A0A2T828_9BACI|nr:ROK family protein [Pontibacillus yanchengensis]KGP71684.1 ROK family transcriptional regulator [Pontibacillus yanchengensis Y32]